MEDLLKAALQYGALGLFCAYLIWQNQTSSKDMTKLLSDIKEIFQTQLNQTTIHQNTIAHERDKNEDCYDKVVKGLEDIKTVGKEIVVEIGKIQTDSKAILANQEKCANCAIKAKQC